MKQIAVRVDDELLAAIEAARGEVPRERWMRAALSGAASVAFGPVTLASDPAQPPGTYRAERAGRVVGGGHLATCKCAVCKPPKATR